MSHRAPESEDRENGAQTPRWVKISGIFAAIFVLVFAVLHLAGNGMGRHGRHRAREAPHSNGWEAR